MLDINLIRKNPEWIAEQLRKRGIDVVDFGALLKLDARKRKMQQKLDEWRAERNRVSEEIPKIKIAELREARIAAMRELGEKIAGHRIDHVEKKIFDILAALPNIPYPEVAAGGKEKNRIVKTFGAVPVFDFKPKDHVELCTSLGLIDYERAAKMSGAGTWVYTGMGARLEWALLNYFINFHVANGYTFVMPPYLLNWESGYAAGQFPKFTDDVFILGEVTSPRPPAKKMNTVNPGLRFLLPTSETALINMHRDEIVSADKLPIKYAGYSACFRNEAAGYGSKERGMIRGYQFNKIEMFIFCLAADSGRFFEELVANAEELVEGLGLHYQTVAVAAGDMGAAMAKTYDIEVYIPSMGGYKEVSSCSNAADYQARRAAIRTKVQHHECDDNGCRVKTVTEFLHTLNASGLATSRIIPAIVEQFQTKDGRVRVPAVLQKYLGGVQVI